MISSFLFLKHMTLLTQVQELQDFSSSPLPLNTLSLHICLFQRTVSAGWHAGALSDMLSLTTGLPDKLL